MAVLAIDENSCKHVLVRQFRQPVGSILLEVPAGKLEGEDPADCARRELAEETGLSGASWTEAGWVYLSPGFCNEKIHLFITRGLSRTVAATADADEHIEVLRLPLAEAARLVETGEIIDAKTVLLLQKALLTSA